MNFEIGMFGFVYPVSLLPFFWYSLSLENIHFSILCSFSGTVTHGALRHKSHSCGHMTSLLITVPILLATMIGHVWTCDWSRTNYSPSREFPECSEMMIRIFCNQNLPSVRGIPRSIPHSKKCSWEEERSEHLLLSPALGPVGTGSSTLQSPHCVLPELLGVAFLSLQLKNESRLIWHENCFLAICFIISFTFVAFLVSDNQPKPSEMRTPHPWC